MAVVTSHPLKGILNANEDPTSCCVCCAPIVLRARRVHDEENDSDPVVSQCCGSSFCTISCSTAGPRRACPQCKAPMLTSQKQIVGSLKKNAKKAPCHNGQSRGSNRPSSGSSKEGLRNRWWHRQLSHQYSLVHCNAKACKSTCMKKEKRRRRGCFNACAGLQYCRRRSK